MFTPVILGTDANAYGVARSFHKEYGKTSYCFGRKPLLYTRDSKIVNVHVDPNFEDNEVFLKTLIDFAKERPGDKLLLISCSDGYTSLITKNSEVLKEYYLFNYVDSSMQKLLENKEDFYNMCEKENLPYPKTYIIDKNMYETGEISLPFSFPIALKANDSIEFFHLHFEGKKKAYKIHSEDEFNLELKRIYDAGYSGDMIAQEFIEGGPENMAVLNAYVDKNGKVRMMCLGRCLLDAVLPEEIGNYDFIYTDSDENLYETYGKFLESIGYRGFANFDLKYDDKTKTYKAFEINIRQGRSSYYMTAGGCNFVKFLVEDLVLNLDKDPYYHSGCDKVWLYVDPWVAKKYVAKDKRVFASRLLRRGFEFTQWYEKDRNLKRFLAYVRARLSSIKTYWRYKK